jgi:hypothetical protein
MDKHPSLHKIAKSRAFPDPNPSPKLVDLLREWAEDWNTGNVAGQG